MVISVRSVMCVMTSGARTCEEEEQSVDVRPHTEYENLLRMRSFV